mgnify:CR=1 FL=1
MTGRCKYDDPVVYYQTRSAAAHNLGVSVQTVDRIQANARRKHAALGTVGEKRGEGSSGTAVLEHPVLGTVGRFFAGGGPVFCRPRAAPRAGRFSGENSRTTQQHTPEP